MRHKYSLAVVFITGLAAFLRFYNLSGQSLWSDEGNSVALVQKYSFAEIAQRTAFDIHPPFYYWLLKVWTTIFGTGEIALRSLSAVLGVGVVLLVLWLGKRLFSRQVGLIAAFVAALSPLLVYYSQETRMYMLLAFLCCLTVVAYQGAGVGIQASGESNHSSRLVVIWYSVLYVFAATAGLYTHYAYAVILVVVNVAALFYFINNSQLTVHNSQLIHWIALQLIPILLYLPWLPTAWRQITTWPTESVPHSFAEITSTITATVLVGLSWPYSQSAILFVLLLVNLIAPALFYVLRFTHYALLITHYSLLLLYLWFGLPVLLTVLIFSPAFLKFLVVAVPPLTLLAGLTVAALVSTTRRRWSGYLVGGLLLVVISGMSLAALFQYYTNPTFARDNYRGIAQFIRAVADSNDAIILNAEGQQDVFKYYYPAESGEATVYPLPRRRPLNEADTLAELQTIAGEANNVYAVYWASQQADPDGVIENWLDTNLFKATDQWYGNVRLVSYASPQSDESLTFTPLNTQLGDNIQLTDLAIASPQVSPGDILQVALKWQTTEPLAENYTVFLQLLDESNHLAGQRDAQPGVSTTDWPVGEKVTDSHGIFVEPGTLPGSYRLIGGLYNSQTGQRLPVNDGGADFVELDNVEVVSPSVPLPLEAFNMQVSLNAPLLDISLLGYDFYKLGHRSTPDTPLYPGDPVQLVAYWAAGRAKPQVDEQLTIRVVEDNGEPTPVEITVPLVSANYPPEQWRAGEIVRGQYDLFLSNLQPGAYRLTLTVSGADGERVVVLTEPFRVTSGE